MKGRLGVVGAGLVAVLFIAASTNHPKPPRPEPVQISFVASPEKADLLRLLVKSFNTSSGATLDGRPVKVNLHIANSGDADSAIASGRLKPVVWSPASSLWGRLLNFDAGRDLVPSSNPSIVRTPLVVAMWQPMAEALGWPHRPISLRQILNLATSGQGWAGIGHREFGSFKLGHTDPDVSTSGLSAVVAEYYAEGGGPRTLGRPQLRDPRLQAAIKAIEDSVVHYGDTTLSFAQQLKRYGPAYASAVAMEETTLVQVNKANPSPKLVAIYPSEGTFFSDSPFIILTAPWVSSRDRDAAAAFRSWLQSRITPRLAARYGFRAAERDAGVPPPLDAANGVNPHAPARQLPLPSPPVLAAIRNDWRDNRKAVNAMIVVDTSDAMNGGGKLDAVKRALREFIRSLSPSDRVGIITTGGDHATVQAPLGTLKGIATGVVEGATSTLESGGDNSLYAAMKTAIADVSKKPNASRINAVVVIAAGNDNRSAPQVGLPDLTARLERQASSRDRAVAVYPIAYGPDANRRALASLADASRGFEYESSPAAIQTVLQTIASYF